MTAEAHHHSRGVPQLDVVIDPRLAALRHQRENPTYLNQTSIHGMRPITADTALRLGLFFQMTPRFWMNPRTEYDVQVATRDIRGKPVAPIGVFEPCV